MTNVLEIDGKFFQPIKEVAGLVSYSRDYITRLAREEKIVATYVGRQWFVDVDSLKSYVASVTAEQEIRKKQLSTERKREREIRQATTAQHTLHLRKARTLHVRSVVTAMLVLGCGLLGGVATYEFLPQINSAQVPVLETQVAQAPAPAAAAEQGLTSPVNKKAEQEVSVSIVTPTKNIQSMGEGQYGVLLLPTGGTDTLADADIELLFSDQVVATELADGTTVVSQVDAAGRVTGPQVPLVRVPVNLATE